MDVSWVLVIHTVTFIRLCLPSIPCCLKLVNKSDQSSIKLPIQFLRNIFSASLQWKDLSIAGWADASQVLQTSTVTCTEHLGELRFFPDLRLMIPRETGPRNILKRNDMISHKLYFPLWLRERKAKIPS